MAFAYFKETLKNVFLQPAIIFVIVIQTVILLFIAFGISFEYQKDVLLSVSIMGREPLEGENLIVFRSMVLHFIPLFWSIFMFLYIIGTSAAYSEMFKDPLLNILLTKKYSRTQILSSRYLGVVAAIILLQFLFSVGVTSTVYFKTGSLLLYIFLPMILTAGIQFLLITSLSGLFALVFENATATMVLTLVIYYYNSYLTAGISLSNSILKFFAYLFPPLFTIDKIFMDTMIHQSSDVVFPLYSFIFIVVYFGTTVLIFKRRDL